MRKVLPPLFVLATLSALLCPPAAGAQPAQPLADDVGPDQPIREHVLRERIVPTATARSDLMPKAVPAPGESLFAGNDVSTVISNVSIDLTTGVATPLFMVDAWGAAFDSVNGILYHSDGSSLYQWPLTGAPILMGTVMDTTGATVTLHGLAFYGGTLYATSISTDKIYTVDLGTLVATTFIDLVDTSVSISGLAADPTDGTLYGTDDLSNIALVRINLDGTVTVIAPYLGGETDVDGLAIDSNRQAYLVTDDNTPPEYNIFDLNTMTWVGTLPYPWGADSANQVSGAILVTGVPDVTLIKTGTLDLGGNGLAEPGDSIAYTFTVTNTGSVTLTSVAVTDPLPGLSAITCPSGNPIPSLAVAASENCTATLVLSQADVDSGQIDNTATAISNEVGPVQDTESIPLPAGPVAPVPTLSTWGLVAFATLLMLAVGWARRSGGIR